MASPSVPLHKDNRRLFLALLLVKSKQTGVSAKEQLRQIRQHIQPGSQQDRVESRSYIDTVAYWKEHYTKSEDALAKMQQQVFRLERENQELRERANPHARAAPIANTPRKRKRTVSQSQHPRDTVINLGGECLEGRLRVTLDEIECSLPDLKTARYLDHLYALQTTLTQSCPTPKDLADTIIVLCEDIADMVLNVRPLPDKMTSTPEHRFRTRTAVRKTSQAEEYYPDHSMLKLVGRTVVHIIKSLNMFAPDKYLGALEGKIIYSIASLARATLLQITEISTQPLPEQSQIPRMANEGRGRARSVPGMRPEPFDPKDIRAYFGVFLIQMLASLNLTKPVQKRICDSILFYVISRAGVLLKAFAFQERSGPRPLGQTQLSPDVNSRLSNAELLSLQSEAPYILWILERAIIISRGSNRAEVAGHHRQETRKPRDTNETDDLVLSNYSREQLQNTMLKAVFEEDETTFEDRLLPPMNHVPVIDAPEGIPTNDVPNWYKGQIWAILGWEILQNNISWEAS